jgi:hypothetical protein
MSSHRTLLNIYKQKKARTEEREAESSHPNKKSYHARCGGADLNALSTQEAEAEG